MWWRTSWPTICNTQYNLMLECSAYVSTTPNQVWSGQTQFPALRCTYISSSAILVRVPHTSLGANYLTIIEVPTYTQGSPASITSSQTVSISIPLTIKIRIQGNESDIILAQKIAAAGADALIVHGRRWMDDYDIACDLQQIAQIKQNIPIPVIANGDISSSATLKNALEISACDSFMIARAGSGRPWLYQELLEQRSVKLNSAEKIKLFLLHLKGLAQLEDEFKAVLQSKSLVRYYFKKQLDKEELAQFYKLTSLEAIKSYLQQATLVL